MNPLVIVFVTTFLTSAVESVEALTIVLAVGLTSGWRPALRGAGAAVLALAIPVGLFGQLVIPLVPQNILRLAVGIPILWFGIKWLRKAVRRSAGLIPLHDEGKAFRETLEAPGTAFGLAFQGVFAEGLEVAFIVFAVGGAARALPVAGLGAAAAALAVVGAGLLVRAPLERVPENLIKYVVGVIAAAQGLFWTAEGLGFHWPGDYLSLLPIAASIWLGSAVAVRLVGQRRAVALAAG